MIAATLEAPICRRLRISPRARRKLAGLAARLARAPLQAGLSSQLGNLDEER
jgi:hypothetical protein